MTETEVRADPAQESVCIDDDHPYSGLIEEE